jgi:hypothetical protein
MPPTIAPDEIRELGAMAGASNGISALTSQLASNAAVLEVGRSQGNGSGSLVIAAPSVTAITPITLTREGSTNAAIIIASRTPGVGFTVDWSGVVGEYVNWVVHTQEAT